MPVRDAVAADAIWPASAPAIPKPRTLPLAVADLAYQAGGRALLAEVSFTIRPGTFNVILGPNGAGKSLLLRLCHGLLEPQHGRIDWNGLTPAQARAHHAMVLQHPVLLQRSVEANVDYPLAIHHVPRAERRQRVSEALEATGLQDLARMPAPRLSGGEQQRLAIARAIVNRPAILIADEPTASLDQDSARRIMDVFRDFNRVGVTTLIASHDLRLMASYANRTLHIDHSGRFSDFKGVAA